MTPSASASGSNKDASKLASRGFGFEKDTAVSGIAVVIIDQEEEECTTRFVGAIVPPSLENAAPPVDFAFLVFSALRFAIAASSAGSRLRFTEPGRKRFGSATTHVRGVVDAVALMLRTWSLVSVREEGGGGGRREEVSGTHNKQQRTTQGQMNHISPPPLSLSRART